MSDTSSLMCHKFEVTSSVARLAWRPGFDNMIASAPNLVDCCVYIWNVEHPSIPYFIFRFGDFGWRVVHRPSFINFFSSFWGQRRELFIFLIEYFFVLIQIGMVVVDWECVYVCMFVSVHNQILLNIFDFEIQFYSQILSEFFSKHLSNENHILTPSLRHHTDVVTGIQWPYSPNSTLILTCAKVSLSLSPPPFLPLNSLLTSTLSTISSKFFHHKLTHTHTHTHTYTHTHRTAESRSLQWRMPTAPMLT